MSEKARLKKMNEVLDEAAAMKDLCAKYGTLDAHRTMYLFLFYEEMMRELGVWHIYDEEMRLWHVTYVMETRGVYIDVDVAKSGMKMAEEQRDSMMRELRLKTWTGFSPSSYRDKVRLFITNEKLPPLQMTSNGNPQVDKFFLEHYEDQSPTVKLVMDHERASKAVGMYFEKYLSSQVDGIIRASFDQVGAKTLRFSCRDPNFQFVPKRAPDGDIMLEVRRPLGPRPGHVWYAYDYSQIEARIFADKAGEKIMLDAFLAGRDVYDDLTAKIIELTGTELTRRDTKDIFLGKLYGLGQKKMAKKLMSGGVDVDESTAMDVIRSFDETFPSVREYQQSVIRDARQNGQVVNRYGQIINADPDAPYKSVNHLIQSEAARLMKSAMLRCGRYLRELGFGWLVMTIHDELVFEFQEDRRPVCVLKKIRSLMEDNQGAFCVPTPVECSKIMRSWLIKSKCDW